MISYAESSAVLAWLLGEPGQEGVVNALGKADQVATSAITVIECARGLARARHDGRITATEERAALYMLDEAIGSWHVLEISEDVVDRARSSFPVEPVRSLDAIHLASAWLIFAAAGAVTILSLDEGVRANARQIGMTIG